MPVDGLPSRIPPRRECVHDGFNEAAFRSRHDVRAFGEDDTLDGSPLFDDFNLEVRDLFA